MFKEQHKFSQVTAILPVSATQRVVPALMEENGVNALVSDARGTLLQDHWWKRWLPPISPAKTMLQMLVPDESVEKVESTIITEGRLDKQSTGAVFSSSCDHVFFGTEFDAWRARATDVGATQQNMSKTLSVIYCIVGHQNSDRVSKAAIRAGAHGPIVYYSEGRGLRDRLGWLRITKEHEKEVMMVIAEESHADDIFDAMTKAGELHLPGRGFMWRENIEKGMFNLPSRISHHHYEANMQQIINAIDHLSGHNHWRDQTVFELNNSAVASGLKLNSNMPSLEDQVSLTAITPRQFTSQIVDITLDAGAPGVNMSYARYGVTQDADPNLGTALNTEYTFIRCITHKQTAEKICATVDGQGEQLGINNLCMYVVPAPQVATYVPDGREFRAA